MNLVDFKFLLEIQGDITEEVSKKLWHDIEFLKFNLMYTMDGTYIYGTTTENNLKDLLYKCANLGFPVKLVQD